MKSILQYFEKTHKKEIFRSKKCKWEYATNDLPPNSTIEQRRHLLEEFYRRELKAVIPHLLEKYVAIVGKSPTEWRIRSMKTKWGTCNVRDKRIWLALNLAKKHPKCLEYVIVHELTHLHVPNHSKAFWARMDIYYPQWREIRKLLNER